MEIKISIESQPGLIGWVHKPEGEITGVIILIHGLGEHYGRYEHWTRKFLERGFAVIGADLPGHGKSGGRRGHISGLDAVNLMIDELFRISSAQFPGQSPVLYGHSLGGLLALNWLYCNSKADQRAIVTSPWLKLSFNPPRSKMVMAKLVKSIMPAMVQPTGLVAEHLSSDPEIPRKYRNDPKVHDKVSVKLFYDCYTTSATILEKAGSINADILIIHGSEDKITSPEGSKIFSGKSETTTLKIWEGGFHELHNEPFGDEVFKFIINWLEAKK